MRFKKLLVLLVKEEKKSEIWELRMKQKAIAKRISQRILFSSLFHIHLVGSYDGKSDSKQQSTHRVTF